MELNLFIRVVMRTMPCLEQSTQSGRHSAASESRPAFEMSAYCHAPSPGLRTYSL